MTITNKHNPIASIPHFYRAVKFSITAKVSVSWCIVCIGIFFSFSPVTISASLLDAESDQFFTDIKALSSFEDRSTGTPGNTATAAYIKNRLSTIGFKDIGVHSFAVPVVQHEKSTLSVPGIGQSVTIQPIFGNAVTPQAIPAPGLTAPLIYVGNGELTDFNGKKIEDAVVLMELDSGRNWEHAANLGAKALIYVDRGNSYKMLFEDKFELSPIQFPRFWLPVTEARHLFGPFETAAKGLVSSQITLISNIGWQQVLAENIFCIIPGADPDRQKEMIMVDAFYDSTVWVAEHSPGADETNGIATLLTLARQMKENPPKRTVLLIASAAHAQSLAGVRELVWSISVKSKIIKEEKNRLESLIIKTQQTIEGLKDLSFSDERYPEAESMDLVDAAVKERIKTEADALSRQLMQLRLQDEITSDRKLIDGLAQERQHLRRLLWKPSYTDADLSLKERRTLDLVAAASARDQKNILSDARQQRTFIKDAKNFREKVKAYELIAAVSLHLSSHGNGFGAFNYGWLYPFRPKINRVASYSILDETLRQAAVEIEQDMGLAGMFKDTLRPSRHGSWESYFIDRPPLGGEVAALAGYHGLSLVTTHDARAMWGTPYDTLQNMNKSFAWKQSAMVCKMMRHLAGDADLHDGEFPRKGFATLTGSAKFLRHGELFADQPAPGTILLSYQGPARFYTMVDQMGRFTLKGAADSKHSFHKVILEGYKFDHNSGSVIWAIDKNQTDKDAYRVKMRRRSMETDLKMFACSGTTLFNLLEPRTFRYLTKIRVLDGRREADPVRYFYSRLDTWTSNISTIFLEPGTPLKLTLSDSVLNKKFLLLNNSPENPQGVGYRIEQWPFLYRTAYRAARDMWTLLTPRINNLEHSGIFNDRIHHLQTDGVSALKEAEGAWESKAYNRFSEAASKSWALASRVYDDIEKTQKDVLYGVLFYIALFVPFSFCLERLLFSYANIYKRIIAFISILILLIFVIYNVHPAFQLAYSPMVVILAFFIMGLSLAVTLIIFFRFEEEMTRVQSHAQLVQSEEIGRWKAFVAAFLLGVSNLRRRRLRTALTCITLVILTFTIISFTSVKSIRRHVRILFADQHPYQGFLLKNVNWHDLPSKAFGIVANTFSTSGVATPRVWLENEDRTRPANIPIIFDNSVFEARGMIGLSHAEPYVSKIDQVLIGGRWLAADDRQAVILPDRMAEHFGIDPRHPEGHAVSIWGLPFEVVGVFSGEKLRALKDLDGEILTPAIFPREISGAMTEEIVNAMESGDDLREFQSRYQHIAGDLTVVLPYRKLLTMGGRLKGVAVRPDSSVSLKNTAQDLVDRFGLSLFSGEKDGTYMYHASDAMRYSGLPNIMVPILISIFIVLNTMISSVYERKREIGIYTSVGLAPSHVSFLFIAEAMAFGVLSIVFGYLVAQTTAKLFADTALWSGITVNYSSAAGVGAMVLVLFVVMISVVYPSRAAGEIAIPDINRSWTLPPAIGNKLEIVLPFLMTYKEHRSVGGFLYEYFESHREITHGKFSTGNITFKFVCEDPPSMTNGNDDCPEDDCAYEECLHLNTKVWLAPFDFGIMQHAALKFKPALGEPGFLEIHVELTRKSGEANAWHRINKTFLHQIRKHLLMWRSFNDAKKIYYENRLTEAINTELTQ